MRTRNDDLKINDFNASYKCDRPGDNHKEFVHMSTNLFILNIGLIWKSMMFNVYGTFYGLPNSPPASVLSK